MLRPRIIPCLLVSNKGLVKTVKFGASKYVGDPINAVRIFNEKEVDELIVLDIDATTTGSEPNFRMIRNLAAECRMPLCYGGGIKTVDQAKAIIGLGVLNSIDNDGEMKGYDLILAKKIREKIGVPMTVLGGAGSLKDIGSLINNFGVIGAAAGSLFVFKGAYRAVLINYPNVVERDSLILNNLRTT